MSESIEKQDFLPYLEGTCEKTFQRTHPWLSFHIDLGRAPPALWLALGEAKSKCEHLAGVPLKPAIAEHLHQLFLAKGAHATTAIEGNTLSEEQVLKRVRGEHVVPSSQEYLQTEIDNVLDLSNQIMKMVENDGPIEITPKQIRDYNRLILRNLDCEDHVTPGEYREGSVGVYDYKAPDCQECPYLIARLCEWLNSDFRSPSDDQSMIYGIIKSVVAHLYLAWIHAFGDGNGRLARAIEVRFLMESGVPSSAIHLLSNHYNQTRTEYYKQLSRARGDGGVNGFLTYSVAGMVDQLREQLKTVKAQQWKVAWENYIYETFGPEKSSADKRQIKLLLALSDEGELVRKSEIRKLNAEIALEYATKTAKTVSRDLNRLDNLKLIQTTGNSVRANRELILAFLPRMRKGDWEAQYVSHLPDGIKDTVANGLVERLGV